MFMCCIYVRRIVLRPKGSKFMLQECSVTLRAFENHRILLQKYLIMGYVGNVLNHIL
jgi:hypothetical protein